MKYVTSYYVKDVTSNCMKDVTSDDIIQCILAFKLISYKCMTVKLFL